MMSPGIATPNQILGFSAPIWLLFNVGAAPTKIVRANLRVKARCPNKGLSESI